MKPEDQHIDLGEKEPFEHTYDVPLTMSDKIERTDILCQLRDQRDREEELLTGAKSVYKDRCAQIDIREREIFRELRTQQRQVTGLCIERKNYEGGTVEIVVIESGQVVFDRPMSEEEHQMALDEGAKGEDLGSSNNPDGGGPAEPDPAAE